MLISDQGYKLLHHEKQGLSQNDSSNTKHRETVQDSLLVNTQSDSTQGSDSTGPVK